jgi:hypothetical protein
VLLAIVVLSTGHKLLRVAEENQAAELAKAPEQDTEQETEQALAEQPLAEQALAEELGSAT